MLQLLLNIDAHENRFVRSAGDRAATKAAAFTKKPAVTLRAFIKLSKTNQLRKLTHTANLMQLGALPLTKQ